MAADKVILGADPACIYSTDSGITGLNNNVLAVGGSGSGKTMSVSEPVFLETRNRSLIATVTKRRIISQYTPLMAERGYVIWDLDFVHPERGNAAYDPLDCIGSYQDVTFLARSIVMSNPRRERSNIDPYWDEAAISLFSAEIAYVLMTKEDACFADVLEMHDRLSFDESGSQIATNYDDKFKYLEKKDPSCFAVNCWKSFRLLPLRTASCVFGTLNAVIDTVFSLELRKMFRMKEKINFEQLASRKTVLFVTTSPVNPAVNCFINLFYGQAFKQLFEFGEEQPDLKLPVPVHVLADDFATGCPVPMFDKYISIFREKGISVTLLIQSESQLTSLYGDDAATTIINNCDSYVYMGSNDLQTAQNISLRVNRPLDEVLALPLGREILFRRGQKPLQTGRYQILEDERYRKLILQRQSASAENGR